jgi:hypothetical protein
MTGSADDELVGISETTRRLTMSEPKDLVEQLQRSNRRWKTLALAACSVLVLAALLGFVAMYRERMQAQQLMRDMDRALVNAQRAANSGLPR